MNGAVTERDPVGGGRAGGMEAPDVLDRTITLVLPGSVTWDGSRYWAFRPYAELANRLTRYFARVIVCTQALHVPGTSGSDGPFVSEVEVQPLPEPPSEPTGVLRNLFYQWRRARALLARMRGWDLVYVFIPSYPGAIAYTVNRIFGRRPMAVYIANDWEEYAVHQFRWSGWRRKLLHPPYRGVLARWEGWIMRSTALGITAGGALLQKYRGAGRPVFETVPLLRMKRTDMVRREDTCLTNPVRLLYVGSLTPRKGLPLLVGALAELSAEGRDLVLDVVGEGTERAELDEQIRRCGLEHRVRFHGFVPNGPELFRQYRESDMFVLPTYSEGFPRVLYEALGHSLPTVTTAVSGIPYLLRDGEHALLVPPGDARALAAAIRRLLTDGTLRRHIIRQGFDLVGPIVARDPAAQFVDLYRRHVLSEHGAGTEKVPS